MLIKAILIFVLASMAFGFFAFLALILFGASFFGMVFNVHNPVLQHAMDSDELMMFDAIANNGFTWVSGIALFVAALVIVILIVHVIMRVLGKGKSLGRMLWIYLAIFFVSLIVGISSLVGFGIEMEHEPPVE